MFGRPADEIAEYVSRVRFVAGSRHGHQLDERIAAGLKLLEVDALGRGAFTRDGDDMTPREEFSFTSKATRAHTVSALRGAGLRNGPAG